MTKTNGLVERLEARIAVLERRVLACETVIFEEVDPDECGDEMNKMLVIDLRERLAAARSALKEADRG
jgi:hypothetical protein